MRSRVVLPLLILAAASCAADQVPGLLVRVYDIGQTVPAVPELAEGQKPNEVRVVGTLDLSTERKDFGALESDFATEVVGDLQIEQAGVYAFRLISDDGALLWIDDQLVVDNDGLHGAQPKDGSIHLAAGAHSLHVWHMQGGGDAQLTLQWKREGGDVDFALIPAAVLTHGADASKETAPGRKRFIPPLRKGRPGDGTPLAAPHPTHELVITGSGMYGVAEHSDFRCDELQICAGLPPQVTGSVVWLPPRAGSAGGVFRPHLIMPAAVTERLKAGAPLEGFDACLVPWVVGVRGGSELYRIVAERSGTVLQGVAFRYCGGFPGPIIHVAGALPGGLVVEARVEKAQDYPDGRAICFLRSVDHTAFEMAAVRALSNGLEIEFTKPLDPRCGWDPESYYVEQWPFDIRKGRVPRRDGVMYPAKSASVSPERTKVFLEIADLKPSHVIYVRLLPPCLSAEGELPWSTEAWYTLHAIPTDSAGEVRTPPPVEPQNVLADEEQQQGWRLLFDGRTTKGWHGYRKDSFPEGWVVRDGCLTRVGPGGDIATDEEFENFELQLEWRIAAAGNSGIFYRVDEQHGWPWETGPEMQVLDNAEHPDGRDPRTSAGSNYALHAPVRDVTQPVGLFNQACIVADGGHVEHWLNGVKVVEYELGSPEWQKLVAASKFKAWPEYGRVKKGRIVLQDHGDRVWYRNVKVRPRP